MTETQIAPGVDTAAIEDAAGPVPCAGAVVPRGFGPRFRMLAAIGAPVLDRHIGAIPQASIRPHSGTVPAPRRPGRSGQRCELHHEGADGRVRWTFAAPRPPVLCARNATVRRVHSAGFGGQVGGTSREYLPTQRTSSTRRWRAAAGRNHPRPIRTPRRCGLLRPRLRSWADAAIGVRGCSSERGSVPVIALAYGETPGGAVQPWSVGEIRRPLTLQLVRAPARGWTSVTCRLRGWCACVPDRCRARRRPSSTASVPTPSRKLDFRRRRNG